MIFEGVGSMAMGVQCSREVRFHLANAVQIPRPVYFKNAGQKTGHIHNCPGSNEMEEEDSNVARTCEGCLSLPPSLTTHRSFIMNKEKKKNLGPADGIMDTFLDSHIVKFKSWTGRLKGHMRTCPKFPEGNGGEGIAAWWGISFRVGDLTSCLSLW